MPKISRILLLFALVTAPLFAQSGRKLGEVVVNVDGNTIPVRVSASSGELQSLAQKAFGVHGRYRVVPSGHAYDLKFSAITPTQVRVEITRGAAATPVASQVVNGTTPSHALLEAADFAVEKTSGIAGLRGFFTDQLAFVAQRGGKGEVFTSDLFFSKAKQLTFDNAHVITPRWAPGGARVVYTSYFKTGAPDIYVHDTSSGRRDIVARYRGTNSGARFSPSGQQIAMVLSGSGTTEIWVSDANGRGAQQRTRADATKSSPCWSPDGRQILFAMDPGPQLYVMPAGGGAPRRLSVGLGTYAAEPDWSRANPNKIACTVRSGPRYQIAVYDMATGKGQIVSKADFDGVEPSWLGDGRHLVYTARDRSTSVLCILDTETGKSTPITGKDTFAQQASVLSK